MKKPTPRALWFAFVIGSLSPIVAVIVTVVYYAFGVDFALLWGLLFFVMSFIPNIGFVLSVIPPFFIALMEFGFTRAAIVVIVVIILNSIVDNGISPRVMARSVGLTTLTIFLSLVFWAWVLGALGAILAVPLTMMVKKLVLESNEGTRWVADLIGSGSPAGRRRRTRTRRRPPARPRPRRPAAARR